MSDATLSWVQWLILIGLGLALILGLRWGLPSKSVVACLLADKPLLEQQQQRLESVRDFWRQKTEARKAREARDVLHGEKIPHYDGPLGFGHTAFEDERLADFYSFILGTPDPDERKTYGALYYMKPEKLDFDPKTWYGYGGSYLYPLGFLLYLAKTLGLLVVTSEVMYYVRHPENTAIMYSTGRLLSIVCLLGTIIVLYKLGARLAGRFAGTTAMLAFGLSTLPLNQALVSKPHMYASFWALLSVYLILRYLDGPSTGRLLLAAGAAGWGFGASMVAGGVALLFPFLLFDFRELRGSVFCILMCWSVMAAVFLLTNPYAVVNPERYLLDFTSIGFFSSYNFLVASTGKIAAYLREMVMKSYFMPISVLGVLGMVAAILQESGFARRLAFGTMVLLILMSVTVNNARITLFVGPLLCLFSGYALYYLTCHFGRSENFVKVGLLVAAFAPGVFFAGLSVRDAVRHDHWYQPTVAWIKSKSIGEGTSIGLFQRPAPTNAPPFPFVNCAITNLREYAPGDQPPQYVVLGYYENPHEWESHPLRSRYDLGFNLGYRSSYDWLLDWRTPLPRTAALVYTLRDH